MIITTKNEQMQIAQMLEKFLQEKNNRVYKNSVFVDLFSTDETAKENFLSLYNALHGTNFKLSETQVEIKTLERTLYMGFRNDVSALINGKLLVLIEHQSTINENMPLRFLEYVAQLYKQLVPLEKLHPAIFASLVFDKQKLVVVLKTVDAALLETSCIRTRCHVMPLIAHMDVRFSKTRILLIFYLPKGNSRYDKNDKEVIFVVRHLKFW